MSEEAEDGVRCLACNHYCSIAEGETGVCRVRKNIDGELQLLVYSRAVSYNLDPVEKKPLYHFLPKKRVFSVGTIGCNFRCGFCQNYNISQKSKLLEKSSLELELKKYGYELPPEKVVRMTKENNAEMIAYTYNEPTVFFEYAYDTAEKATEEGLKNIFVSNGYISEEALRKIAPFLDAINIDLKSFSEEFYNEKCGAKLEPVLKTIELARELGVWVEVTTLLIPEENQEDLERIAEFIAGVDKSIPWHISAFKPMHEMTDSKRTEHEELKEAYKIGKEAGMNHVYVGNVVDEERNSTYCPGCDSVLIKRSSYHVSLEGIEDGRCENCGEEIGGVWS